MNGETDSNGANEQSANGGIAEAQPATGAAPTQSEVSAIRTMASGDGSALKESVGAIGEIAGTAGSVTRKPPCTTKRVVRIGDPLDVFFPSHWDGPQPGVVTGGPYPAGEGGGELPGTEGSDRLLVTVNVEIDGERFQQAKADLKDSLRGNTLARIPLYDSLGPPDQGNAERDAVFADVARKRTDDTQPAAWAEWRH